MLLEPILILSIYLILGQDVELILTERLLECLLLTINAILRCLSLFKIKPCFDFQFSVPFKWNHSTPLTQNYCSSINYCVLNKLRLSSTCFLKLFVKILRVQLVKQPDMSEPTFLNNISLFPTWKVPIQYMCLVPKFEIWKLT